MSLKLREQGSEAMSGLITNNVLVRLVEYEMTRDQLGEKAKVELRNARSFRIQLSRVHLVDCMQ